MKKIVKIATLALMMPVMSALVSCDDVFEPGVENIKNEEAIKDLPLWVNGLLSHAYISNPLDGWTFNDVATDDAVSNQPDNAYLQMALGSWTSNNNPTDQWRDLRGSIQFLNMVIEMAPGAPFAEIETTQAMFVERLQGEAYGLRALFMYHLLRHHAGLTEDGQLLGVPIVLESENVNSNFNVPRNTFQECYEQLMKDADLAISMLPDQYVDLEEVPAKYQGKGVNIGEYNRVWGTHMGNRMNARVARAVKAQAALMAASPAFEASGVTYTDAAELYADVLADLGANPVAQLDPSGHLWYANNKAIADLGSGKNPLEIMWRGNKSENGDIERNNYPPADPMNGNGNINPTQNLVNAFPMANGYPITDANSGYDAANPYVNRDPRLSKYVVYNGSTLGSSNTVINTGADNPNNNSGLNILARRSTRTGYYMRKHLNENVSINTAGDVNPAYHYNAFIRYTEMFLSYAEAANEAYGPTADGGNGYSAYDVVKAIRARAGVGADNGDAYLESIKNDKDKMRELIRNERRLELCFEGHRFWDLRRWKANLNETAKGVRISGGSYEEIEVEQRAFKDYQYYGPIPYSEVVKFSNLEQNKGW